MESDGVGEFMRQVELSLEQFLTCSEKEQHGECSAFQHERLLSALQFQAN